MQRHGGTQGAVRFLIYSGNATGTGASSCASPFLEMPPKGGRWHSIIFLFDHASTARENLRRANQAQPKRKTRPDSPYQLGPSYRACRAWPGRVVYSPAVPAGGSDYSSDSKMLLIFMGKTLYIYLYLSRFGRVSDIRQIYYFICKNHIKIVSLMSKSKYYTYSKLIFNNYLR
jgi:hypothetical protein